jgi:hypothetical protein
MVVHLHVASHLTRWIDGNRTDGGQVQHRTGPKIETRAVPPAFDDPVVHVAFGQSHRFMGALVVHREHFPAGAHHADGDLINDDTQRYIVEEIAARAVALPTHRSGAVTSVAPPQRPVRSAVGSGRCSLVIYAGFAR